MSIAIHELPGTRRVEQIMGLPIVVDVRDDDEAGPALERLFDWLRWVDATFSTFKENSEISRMNRGVLRRDDAHPEVRRVLDRCDRLRDETRGYFDMRAPDGSIDPSGLVKGWAIDRAAAILDEPVCTTMPSAEAATCAFSAAQSPSSLGAWASSILSTGSRSRPSWRPPILRLPRPGLTRVATTCGTLIPVFPRAASSR
jgi:hypothetical protein